MEKRIYCFASIAIVAVMLLSLGGACRPIYAPAMLTPEPVTISFAYLNWDDEYYERLVPIFNESFPHITVDLQPTSWSLLGRLDTDRVDVFWTESSQVFVQLHKQGKLKSLTAFIEGSDTFDLADYYPGVVEFYSLQGNTWAIPTGVDPMVMYYNKDLLDRYGVAYPDNGWTWEDFLEAGLAIRDPGAGVFGYADSADISRIAALLFVYQHGGKILDDWQYPTRTTFDDPLTLEALEWYAGLVHEYGIAPTQEDAHQAFRLDASAGHGFMAGQVGMFADFFSARVEAVSSKRWTMRWGMVTMPRDRRATTTGLSFGHAISAQSPHPQACWQWIAFLSEQIPPRGVPARRSLAASATYEQQVGPEIAAVARASMEDVLQPFFVRDQSLEAIEDFMEAIDYMIDEGMAPQEALDLVQQDSEFK